MQDSGLLDDDEYDRSIAAYNCSSIIGSIFFLLEPICDLCDTYSAAWFGTLQQACVAKLPPRTLHPTMLSHLLLTPSLRRK